MNIRIHKFCTNYMKSYITHLLGTDVMASKKTQRKLMKANQNRPKDLSKQVQRKTVLLELQHLRQNAQCKSLSFLDKMIVFISPLKVVLNVVITHFSKLILFFAGGVTWSKAILIYCPFFSVLKLPLFKFLKLCNA